MKTTATTTATTCPAAAGLALASLAAELLIQAIAAVLIPAIALALTLAGCGHQLALAARRRREAMAEAAEAAVVTSPEVEAAADPSLADLFAAASQEMARSDARLYRSVGRHVATVRQLLDQVEHEEAPAAAAVTARREGQVTAYRDLAGLAVRELRQMARAAGHRQLARQGRRGELLAALVPA